MTDTLTARIRRRPLWLFFVLAYALSWTCWLPLVLGAPHREWLRIAGTFGPTLSALALTYLLQGRAGLRALLRRLLAWRVGISWYLFSAFSTAAIVLLALGLDRLLGGAPAPPGAPQPWYVIWIAFPYVLVTSVLGEEIGWRGYALPRLQGRHTALTASLILGAAWSCWHLPLFWMEGNFHQSLPVGLFILQNVALTVVMTWLYNHTGGSLLIAHLFHTASNVTLGLLPILPAQRGGETRPLWLAVSLLLVLTLGLVAWSGPERLSRSHPNDQDGA